MAKFVKEQKVKFDYDKLAEAIVKAEQKVKEEENKIDDTSYFLKVLLVSSFVLVTVVLWMFFGVSLYMALTGKLQPANVVETISLWVMISISFVYSITSLFLTYKISKINDKNYLISYFGAISGLLALIVSVLAFIRG